MAFVNPKIVLLTVAAIYILFSLGQLLNPLAFMKQYNMDFSEMKVEQEMIMIQFIQGWGWANLLIACFCLAGARVGSENTQGLLCLSLGCTWVFCLIMMFVGWDQSVAYQGGKTGGMIFNAVLIVVFMIAAFAGASWNFKMSSLGKPVYWASIALGLMYLGYFFMQIFSPETLLTNFGFKLEGDFRKLCVFMMKFGMSCPTIQVFALLVAACFSNDVGHQYILNRALSVYLIAVFAFSCSSATWWATSNEAAGSAMMKNNILILILFVLAFHSNAKYDDAIVPACRKAIEEGVQARERPLLG